MSDKPGSPQQKKDLSPAKQALLEKRLQAALQQSTQQPAIPHRSAQGFTALSYGQEGLWFASQLDASSPVYNRPVALRLSGILNRKALKRALEEVLRRHEVLGGRFRIDLGRPLQETSSASELDLAGGRSTGRPPAGAGRKSQATCQPGGAKPVNLAKGPLMRAVLSVCGNTSISCCSCSTISPSMPGQSGCCSTNCRFYTALFRAERPRRCQSWLSSMQIMLPGSGSG